MDLIRFHIAACPLPTHELRNAHLNQVAYSLHLFIRDVAGGDLVGWIGKELMGPIHSVLRDLVGLRKESDVVLIPAGLLALLPLHAAQMPSRGHLTYFLEDWVVSYGPGPAAWLASQMRKEEPRRNGKRLLAVTTAAGRNPAVAAFAPEVQTELAFATATPRAVVAALPRSNYVSLYCHGIWNPGDPTQSALVLSNAETTAVGSASKGRRDSHGNKLTVQMLQRVDLRSNRLALLWACESGMVGLSSNAEAIGFPAALVDAGVPAVVAALWAVDDAATRNLARIMLNAHLERGLSPAAALREAQLAMLSGNRTAARSASTGMEENPPVILGVGSTAGAFTTDRNSAPPLALPFYWAAFTVTGA